LRTYATAWKLHIEPAFAQKRIGAITRRELQAWTDDQSMPRSTLNNALDPLRVLFRYALRRSIIVTNPTADLELPAKAEEAMRFATPAEAETFIEALRPKSRALWATAIYGGLRRGELQALRWSYVDLDKRAITVLKAWAEDDEATKTKAGKRRVPVVPPLVELLKAHKAITGRSGSDLVFGRSASDPFVPSTVRLQALADWKDIPLEPITLHQCRHTAASFMIASGANPKALSVVMGHASIEITFNRYGHLMPGSEDAVGELLAAYLDAA
jgi:integrase